MPLQATSGAASYDGFGGGVAGAAPQYIEDVFSTYLYTGTGANQTIVNGVDLSGSGGLTWIKDRAAANHLLMTTAGGPTNRLRSNGQPSYITSTAGRDFSSFNSNGFSLGIDEQSSINTSLEKYVSWSLRKQPKFFDVVTWTGNGTNRTIAHNLGSVPGCIIIGATTALGTDWAVYHRSLANTEYLTLNSTAAKATGAAYWNSTTATSSVFSLGTDATVNYNTGTYIAYLFAHDAGGFGLSGTDNVISCGTFTTSGGGTASVNLGYEPQWLMFKNSSAVDNWYILDNMRGMSMTQGNDLDPNLSAAEGSYWSGGTLVPTSTGFNIPVNIGASQTYIYIAIRRGPMKVPTDGTKVFSPFTTAAATGTAVTTNFPVDFQLYKYRAGIDYFFDVDRLRGVNSTTTANSTPWLDTTSTAAEASATNVSRNWGNTGFEVPGIVGGASNVFYSFRRAPGFFDEVCFTVSGSAPLTHNLTVRPELVIYKTRGSADSWWTCANVNGVGQINGNSAFAFTGTGNGLTDFAQATSTTISNLRGVLLSSGNTVVAYLFATCAGVSKVGSYTGTGTTQTINCGFTAGARFVLIKRTDSTGDWYVWDSARGIVAGNDPYLLLNSTAAEVTNTDYVDTAATGFEISSTAPAAINASGGTFIFLAIA